MSTYCSYAATAYAACTFCLQITLHDACMCAQSHGSGAAANAPWAGTQHAAGQPAVRGPLQAIGINQAEQASMGARLEALQRQTKDEEKQRKKSKTGRKAEAMAGDDDDDLPVEGAPAQQPGGGGKSRQNENSRTQGVAARGRGVAGKGVSKGKA